MAVLGLLKTSMPITLGVLRDGCVQPTLNLRQRETILSIQVQVIIMRKSQVH